MDLIRTRQSFICWTETILGCSRRASMASAEASASIRMMAIACSLSGVRLRCMLAILTLYLPRVVPMIPIVPGRSKFWINRLVPSSSASSR